MLSRISGPSSGRRGPDNKHWDGTVPGDRGNGKGMTVDEVRLLKTQDMGYVRTVRNSVRRQVEALRQRVALAEQGVFRGSDGDEGEDEEDEKDEAGNDVGRASSKGKVAPPKRVLFASTAAEQREAVLAAREGHQLQQPPQSEDPEGEDNEDDDHEQQLQKLRRELRAAEMKLAGLARVEEEMERERARMAKTTTSAGIDRKTEKLRKVRVRKR